MTENPSDYDNDGDHQRYVRATALVSAVADLMARMLPHAPANLHQELDSNTLAHLAERIYQEALVAESLYVQLEERFNAQRPAAYNLFHDTPQVCLPLWFLSEDQLRQVEQQARAQSEQFDSEGRSMPASMQALMAAILAEMRERGIAPYRSQPITPK